MAKEYRYADAVRLLGGADPAVEKIDLWLGIGTLGLWDVIDAKQQFVQVGNTLLGRWREWRAGRDWHSRTEQIEAAHTILVITAFFEAVDLVALPFGAADLRLSREEQRELARNSGLDLSHSPACPSPHLPFEQAKRTVLEFYESYGKRLRTFVTGLSLWDGLRQSEREQVVIQFDRALPEAALRRYEDRYRNLALDVPEFAFWASMIEHQATRAGFAELERLLSLVAAGTVPPDQLATLARLQRAMLREPLAVTGETAGVRLPTVDEAYVTPRFRVGEARYTVDPSVEAWWEALEVREDLPRFLAGFLTQSMASQVPFVILGQPGAGKSLLTKVLAARLPEGRYLPIRVPLRDVAANADIQQQIEQAVYRLSGERLEWPALARSADGVLPVVLLDGFDELLQATGVRQSDYLERVARFQRREVDAGRAVAVVVTSRTAVADRATFVPGTVVARLEPFDEAQIERWLTVWNHRNDAYFTGQGVRPLALDAVLAQRALAEQPLLLLMLALYDADENALGAGEGVAEFGQAELYERLVRRFVERELEKSYPDDQVPALLEREMLHLSYVAFAMFNRGRQWVTTAELDHDLAGLEFPAQLRSGTFATPLTAGELAIAKFFFVHRAQATRDDDVAQTYEFLHATFGEYLIARLITALLRDLAIKESGLVVTEIDDALLRTLLSWSTLSSRTSIVVFLQELGAGDHGLVMRLFRRLETRLSVPHPNYRPRTAGLARRHAYYSANLLVIALAHTTVLRAGSFLPGEDDPLTEWRSQTLLWRSQCAAGEWASLTNLVQVDVVSPEGGGWDVELRIATSGWAPQPVQLDREDGPATREVWQGMFPPPGGATPEGGAPEPVGLLLDRIAMVCETRHEHAEIRRLSAEPPHLLVTVREDGFVRQYLIGAHVGRVTETDVEAFLRHVHAAVPGPGSELVYQGPPPAQPVHHHALRRGVRLRSFVEFQGLLDLSGYVAAQTARLRSDPRYPPDLYVPQRFQELDRPDRGVRDDLTGELMRLLAADHGCFTLVLGDFGRGKTFALREVARRIPAELPALTPVLIELRTLDKAQSVNGLIAAHLANRGEDLIDLKAFRYMLRQGRVALLFDGFDELVTRVTYDRAADLLETLLRAADEKAKIMVTGHTQHFTSHRQIATALGERAAMLPRRRMLAVEDFTLAQVRSYLVNRYGGDEKAAADRFALLGGIHDLLGLARNPRMLGFIADLPDERLRAVSTAKNTISAAGLYKEILTAWLTFEENRTSHAPGTFGGLTARELWHAASTLALRLWTTGESYLGPADLAEVAEVLSGLTERRLTVGQTVHAIGTGSLLVRTEDGLFGFIHSSVVEWLVAEEIAANLEPADGRSSGRVHLAMRPLSALTVDFLCDLADLGLLQEWATRVLADSGADDVSRANALRILVRLRTPSGTDMRGARLRGQDLSYRDLSGVDLTGADLSGARLVGADLTDTVLRDAHLTRARLDEAVLTGADLRGADLRWAWLARADLRDITTEGSRWDRAALIGVAASPSLALDPALDGAVIVPGMPVSAEVAPAGVGVPFGYRANRLPEPIAYHPDGGTFAVGDQDGGVLVCDSASGLPIRNLRGHRGRVYKVAYGPGVLISGAADGTVRLWDPDTGEQRRVLFLDSEDVWPVVINDSGDLLVAGGTGGILRVLSTSTGDELAVLPGHTPPVHTAVFAGDLLVTGDTAGTIKVWDPRAADLRWQVTGSDATLHRLTPGPDGRLVAAGDSEGRIRLWDSGSGSLVREFHGPEGAVLTLAFDPAGRLLASGDSMGAVHLWDLGEGSALAAPPSHDGAVHHMVFSPDGAMLATGDSTGLVRIWSPYTGGSPTELSGHRGAVWPFVFHPDGHQLATSGNDGTTRLWDPRTGACRHVIRGHGRRVTAARFNADGTMLAVCGNDGIVRLWDPRTSRRVRELTGAADRLVSAVFSPANSMLATAGSDGDVYLWDAATGGFEHELNVGTDYVWAAAFSPDGDVFATANDADAVQLWHVRSGQELAVLREHRGRVRSVAFDPDGRLIATGCDDGVVRLWDRESGACRARLTGHTDRVYAVAYHPLGDRLASAGFDGTVRIWDVVTRECLHVLDDGGGRLLTVAFSPDGSLLATAGEDSSVRLWDPVRGRRLHVLTGHFGRVSSVAFAPPGDLLASAGDDGGVILWGVGAGVPARRSTLLGLPEGWAALTSDGRYKLEGETAGQFWFVAGMRRFEPGELDPHLPAVRRVPLDEPF